MDGFVDSDVGLSRLRGCYGSDEAKLAIIYGRRRLNKTQLVQHSLTGRDDSVVYKATETTARLQLGLFVDIAAETFLGVKGISFSISRVFDRASGRCVLSGTAQMGGGVVHKYV